MGHNGENMRLVSWRLFHQPKSWSEKTEKHLWLITGYQKSELLLEPKAHPGEFVLFCYKHQTINNDCECQEHQFCTA